MANSAPPEIFTPARRANIIRRMCLRQRQPGAADYLFADVAEDAAERIAFLRHSPKRALVLGDGSGAVAAALAGPVDDCPDPGFALDQLWPLTGHDLVVACFAFDSVNDLPGALIQAHRALAPGGLLLATMLGAGSLPVLRDIMLAADGERPSPRLHPQVDVRAGAQLLQRAGFANPVSDSRSLSVRFRSFGRLVGDLRDQGLTSVLAQGGPPLDRAALQRAEKAFAVRAEADGGVTERFELLTLSGWRARA